MEKHLAENIRNARKRMGLTQEQLAERLNITLGTVSKWERGASEPEIGFLMELADVFRISVDALIGFSMRGGDADTEAERIEELLGTVPMEKIREEYERALRRFPNHFRIVLGAAECFEQIATVYKEDKLHDEALSLYRHALELFPQNKNEQISEVQIRNEIAMCYMHKKDYTRAVDEYKRNNVCNLNNAQIGLILIDNLKQDKEGIGYIESAFLVNTITLVTVLMGYYTYYLHVNELEKMIRSIRWGIGHLERLKDVPEEPSYFDKMLSVYHLGLALAYDRSGLAEEADAEIALSARTALAFDADPVITLKNVIFTDHIKSSAVYDDAGATAVDALYGTLDVVKEYVSDSFRERLKAALNTENA